MNGATFPTKGLLLGNRSSDGQKGLLFSGKSFYWTQPSPVLCGSYKQPKSYAQPYPSQAAGQSSWCVCQQVLAQAPCKREQLFLVVTVRFQKRDRKQAQTLLSPEDPPYTCDCQHCHEKRQLFQFLLSTPRWENSEEVTLCQELGTSCPGAKSIALHFPKQPCSLPFDTIF